MRRSWFLGAHAVSCVRHRHPRPSVPRAGSGRRDTVACRAVAPATGPASRARRKCQAGPFDVGRRGDGAAQGGRGPARTRAAGGRASPRRRAARLLLERVADPADAVSLPSSACHRPCEARFGLARPVWLGGGGGSRRCRAVRDSVSELRGSVPVECFLNAVEDASLVLRPAWAVAGRDRAWHLPEERTHEEALFPQVLTGAVPGRVPAGEGDPGQRKGPLVGARLPGSRVSLTPR